MILGGINEVENSFLWLAENLPGIVYRILIDDNNRMVFFNNMVQTMTGYSPEDLKRGEVCSIDPLILPEDKLNVVNIVKNAIENNVPFEVEYRIHNKSGELKWFNERGRPIRGDNGNPSYIDGVIFDITEGKDVEKKLKTYQESLERLSNELETILDHYPGLAFYKDTNNNFIRINQKVVDYYNSDIAGVKANQTKKDIEGKNLFDLLPKDIAQAYWDDDLEVIKSGTPKLNIEKSFKTEHGINWLNSHKIPYFDENGEIRGIIGFSIDITERKKAEQKLKESEKKYHYLFENAQVGLYWLRISDTRIVECNNTFAKSFGYDTREECLAKFNTIEHYIDPNTVSEILKEIRDNIEVKNYEVQITRRDNTPIWVSISARMFEKEDRIEGAAIGITERKQAEQKLKENTEFIQNIFNAIQDGLSVLDIDLNIIKVNPYMIEMYGPVDQIVNRKCYDVYQKRSSPCPWCPSIKTIETGQLNTSIVPYPTSENPTGWIELTAFPVKNSDGIVESIIEYVKDITERKKAEEKLQFERDNFLNILNSMEDGVYIVDKNYDIEYVNPSFIKEFGQFEGIKCFKYFEDRNEICPRCKNKEIFRGKTVRGEWYSFKNQKTYDIIDTPLKNPDGSISKLAIFRDETDKKQAEIIIKESEENYKVLFENSPISLWEEDYSELKKYVDKLKNSGINDLRSYFDENPEEVKKCVSIVKIIDVNQETLELYKADKKEEFFAGLNKVFTEESFDVFKEQIIKLAEGKTRFEAEAINCTLNGDKLFVFLVCEIVAGFQEDWSKVLISIVDISERKKAEKKLIESEEKIQNLINNISDALMEGDIDSTVTFISPQIYDIIGYQPIELIGIKFLELIHPEEKLAYEKLINITPKTGNKFSVELRIMHKKGYYIPISAKGSVVEVNNKLKIFVVIRDITEKRKIDNMMKSEIKKLKNLDQIRSDLIRRISHELKTPLTSIFSGSQYLLDHSNDKVKDQTQRIIQLIHMGGYRLKSLVENMLLTFNIEAKELNLNLRLKNIIQIIKNSIEDIVFQAKKRKIFINLELLKELYIEVDKSMIKRAISNILSNAVKNTPTNGNIFISTFEHPNYIDIIVKDDGVGLTKKEKLVLFKRFGKIERYGKGMDVDIEGAGLGLYITNEIVKLHNGEIIVKSKGRNKGSTFIIRLPIN